MTDESIREECLAKALDYLGRGYSEEEVLRLAQRFYDWVKGVEKKD